MSEARDLQVMGFLTTDLSEDQDLGAAPLPGKRRSAAHYWRLALAIAFFLLAVGFLSQSVLAFEGKAPVQSPVRRHAGAPWNRYC